MKRIFVSGCYDIIHAGHVQFFSEARALGDHLTVCFASTEVLWFHKRRRSSLPDEHKQALIASLKMVDDVVIGQGLEEGIDFREHFLRIRPDVLAVTEDDKYAPLKRALCAEVGADYVVLDKTPPKFKPISTSEIVRYIRAPQDAPLRVDFGGGWLDVPRYAQPGTYIVNCAISPTVSLRAWPYERNAGLGGSGAWAVLNGHDGVDAELDLGVGWQDPAVINETGLCVWHSGERPRLEIKVSGDFLEGCMALYWTGAPHDTPGMVAAERDYTLIAKAGQLARDAVWARSLTGLAEAVKVSYAMQRAEGMAPLPGDVDFAEKPEGADGRPEGGSGRPETGDLRPEGGSGMPETGNLKPEGADGKPETGGLKPEGADGKPEGGSGRPETGDLRPEGVDGKPEGADGRPEGGDLKPEGVDGRPETGDLKPEGGNGRPETGNLKPEGGNGRPETGDLKPEGGSGMPETGNLKPEGDGRGANLKPQDSDSVTSGLKSQVSGPGSPVLRSQVSGLGSPGLKSQVSGLGLLGLRSQASGLGSPGLGLPALRSQASALVGSELFPSAQVSSLRSQPSPRLGGVTPLAFKYSGGGFGGYALYLCKDRSDRDRLCQEPNFRPVEPFVRS